MAMDPNLWCDIYFTRYVDVTLMLPGFYKLHILLQCSPLGWCGGCLMLSPRGGCWSVNPLFGRSSMEFCAGRQLSWLFALPFRKY